MSLAPNRFSSSGVTSPAANAVQLTPSNDELTFITRAVYVGVTGDLNVEMASGQEVVFVGVTAGSLLPIRITKLKVGTSATSVLALY